MNTFLLEERNFSRSNSKAYEGLFTQGNGYLSVRGSFEEGLQEARQNEVYTRTMKSVTTEIQHCPISKWGVYVPLIMGRHPFLGEVILNLPYFLSMRFFLDGQPLDLLHCKVSGYSRSLNMQTGTLLRQMTVEAPGGALVDFQFERFASMARKHLFVQKVRVSIREQPVCLRVISSIDGDVTTNGKRHFPFMKTSEKNGVLSMALKTDLDFGVCMLSALEGGKGWHSDLTDRCAAMTAEWELVPGKTMELVKRSIVTTSRDLHTENYIAEAEQELETSREISYAVLKEENDLAWADQWLNSDIQIDGDDNLQHGLRFSIYHLLRSNMEDDSRVQICAKGFAGEAYYGRYFWDTEIFMLPFFIYTNPKAARNLICYRYQTLEGARRNARRYHCHGARYPWQSGLDGTEQCSLWEYADNEVHITADVAFAVMHYYRATGDEQFMRRCGLEILLETARFWTDRVDADGHGGYNLLNVMGPDEYSPMTRNNAYTNWLVRENLLNAVRMADHIRQTDPECWKRLMSRLSFVPAELEKFKEIAAKLPIPYDPVRRLVLQSEDFENYADIDMNAIWKDRSRAFGYYAAQEKIYRSKCIKQADVIALMTLFPREFTEDEVTAAYEYYMPLTTHDSSLSPAGHSLIANRLGRHEDVERFLKKALEVDLCVQNKGSEDGIHIANCGCLWQLAVHGFAGVHPAMESPELTVEPHLPDHIRSISLRMFWKGKQKEITVTHKGTVVRDI